MQSFSQSLETIPHKRLLVIFPHPDDETVMASGLMHQALALGFAVKVVCVTNGTLGRIHIHGMGRSVIQIRREELKKAMGIVGVSDFEMWQFCDGSLSETSNWQQSVFQIISDYNPGIVVTYGPDGVSGHPDHLALGKQVFELWKKDQNFELWWPSFKGEVLKYLQEKCLTTDRLSVPNVTVELTSDEVTLKKQALLTHESQKLDTPLEWLELDKDEYFSSAKPDQDYNFAYVEFDLGN